MTPSTEPTSTAAMMVPTPTEPSVPNATRQDISEIITIEISNPTFTLLNAIWVVSDTAFIAPSPANGTMSAGR